MSRACGDCTKCCEGYLSGEALGKKFHAGKPCHFVAIGKGCSVYAKRPADPCILFECSWLVNKDIPEWFKPNSINAIVKETRLNNFTYLEIIEAGEVLQSKVLSWFIQYAVSNQLNVVWQIEGGKNWLGSPEFCNAISEASL